tara:strand:- start:91 stop:4623 length:4533 start_codon:yes stop_codon:yes gene_type:complete
MVTEDISWPGTGSYFDSNNSSLNPYNYRSTWVYGTLPLFITKATANYLERDTFISNVFVDTADKLGIDLNETSTINDNQKIKTKAFDSGYKSNLIGRLLSAIVDTGTILIVYLLGRELFNRKVGFISAILQAFTVLHIQYSHFYGAEPWVTFFASLTVLLSVKLFKTIRLSSDHSKFFNPKLLGFSLSIGVTLGLTVASKISGLAVGIVPLIAFILSFTYRTKSKKNLEIVKESAKYLGLAISMLLSAFLCFRVLQPYAFKGLITFDGRFLSDIQYLRSVNSGGNVPWVIQWVGVTPLWFPIKSIFWHGMGPTLAVAVLAGLYIAGLEIIKKQNITLIIPLSFVIVMLGLVSQQFNPLIRYLLPAYPIAITFGGYGIYRLWRWGEGKEIAIGKRPILRRISKGTAAILVAGTVFWGLAFVNGVYNDTHPRISASEWINENIEPGSTITHQIWDDRLPLPIPNEITPQLNYVELDLFRSDQFDDPNSGKSKLITLLDNLEETDYIIEASNRLYDSIPRIPAEYPGTNSYYDALFSGELGFELIANFENSPSLFGLSFKDSNGEETFTVYDHPSVTIWAKTDEWDRTNALKILNPFRATYAPDLEPRDASSNALMLRTSESSSLQNNSTFDDTFTPNSYLGAPQWVWWLLWLQIAAFAVLPWSTLLFRQFADAGYGLSKAIGFLSSGTLLWLFVIWDVFEFNQTTALASMAAIFTIGLALWWIHRVRLFQLFCKYRFVWLASEIIFLAIFTFLLLLRSFNPDLWESYLGGEKPMELGYLTAIGRSAELPPYDPWFAGGAMNYYYFGWFLVAVPMRALKILPEVAFQFGVATFGALVGATIFTLVYNVVMGSSSPKAKHFRSKSTAVKSGILGLFLFMGSGTLDALRVHTERLRQVNTWTLFEDWPVIGVLVELMGGTWTWVSGTNLTKFDWWAPSRVNSGNFDITEFPYFTFLFGDLHPHMMGMAISGLLLAVSFAYLHSCRSGPKRSSLYLAIGIGLLSGLTRITNTWDYPTSLLLLLVTFFLGAWIRNDASEDHYGRNKASLFGVIGLTMVLSASSSGGNSLILIFGAVSFLGALSALFNPINRSRILQFVCHLSLAALTHIAFLWPYLRDTKNFNIGIHRAKWTSPLDDFMSHWGIFLSIAFIFLSSISLRLRRNHKEHNVTVHFLPTFFRRNKFVKFVTVGLCLSAITICTLKISAAFAITIFGGFWSFVLAENECRNLKPDIGKLFAIIMFLFGFAVIGGPEIITVNNDVARMNTVFKFWLQGWLFFAIGSAFAINHIWHIAKEAHDHPKTTTSRFWISPLSVWRIFVFAVVAIGLTYPLLATGPRLSTRFNPHYKGLNGIAYLDDDPYIIRRDQGQQGAATVVQIAEDLPLIQWIRSNIAGSPTIVEWSGDSYDWNSRIAVHTGLPTVLGWSSHQYQQRQEYADWILQRRIDIQNFYTKATQKTASEFLLTYEVNYVVVGVQEHRFGNPDVLASFANHPALTKVFQSGKNVIYIVDTEALWELAIS